MENENAINENINEETAGTETVTEKILPVVPLRGKVLFPDTFLSFDAGRPSSVAAIEAATEENSEIFIAAQKNAFIDRPSKKDIYKTGVIARIKQIVKLPNNTVKLSVQAMVRAKIKQFVATKGYFRGGRRIALYPVRRSRAYRSAFQNSQNRVLRIRAVRQTHNQRDDNHHHGHRFARRVYG